MANYRKTGLILVVTAGALWWAGPAAAQEQDAGAMLQETIQIMNEMGDCLAGIKDQASADAAKTTLASLAGRMQALDARRRSIHVSPDEDNRLREKYGDRMIAAMERMAREQERVEGLGLVPAGTAAKVRSKVEELRARTKAGSSSSSGGGSRSPGEKGSWAFLFPLLMLVIIVACVGTLYTEGMWSNAVRLVNVVFAALMATNFWEPAARTMQDMAPTFTYYWDFLCLWGLFAIFMVIFRALTDTISRVKVRFLKIADQIGSGVFAVWIGYVMVCFTMFTLNTAPLSENFMFGAFRSGESNFYFLAPDLQWAGFMQKMSAGPFARGLGDDEAAKYGTTSDQGEKDLAVFDRNGDFVPKYAARRRALQQYVEEKSTSRAAESDVIKR